VLFFSFPAVLMGESTPSQPPLHLLFASVRTALTAQRRIDDVIQLSTFLFLSGTSLHSLYFILSTFALSVTSELLGPEKTE